MGQTFYLGLTLCCILCFVLLAERFQASNEALWSTLSRKAGWLSWIKNKKIKKNIGINQRQLNLWLTFLFLFQPLPVPDISVADSVHSLAMSCIWVHLAKKVTLKIISDNSTQYYPFFRYNSVKTEAQVRFESLPDFPDMQAVSKSWILVYQWSSSARSQFLFRTHFRSFVKIDNVHNMCKSNLWSGVFFGGGGGGGGGMIVCGTIMGKKLPKCKNRHSPL